MKRGVKMKVIKRDGKKVDFDPNKIVTAISKANREVIGNEKASIQNINYIVEAIEKLELNEIGIEKIQDQIERKLMELGKYELAKRYMLYREKRSIIRQTNTTDESILSLIRNTNKEVSKENSNKNAILLSTQRDLIAGEVSKDIVDRLLLPERIVKAHKEGVLHFHDKDYFIQPMFNCCLINIKDMLDNETVMNGKKIETPKSFQVACTVMTQIIAAVASNQYGGQSVNVAHLGKYLRKTYDKYYKKYYNHFIEEGKNEKEAETLAKDFAEMRKQEDLVAGIQTVQYQINTLMTTNGQSPFVTLFMHIVEGHEYEKEVAEIIEEILKQRLKGIKNSEGHYITPAFPKLIYVLDECNNLSGGKYDDITRLAVKCSAKRLYPDYISAKKMRENYEGNVFSPMGCRSFLSPYKDENGEYKFEGRFNQGVVSINLPQIAIMASGNKEKFYKILDDRLELCFDACMCRHNALKGVTSDYSPIHWQYGAIARLKKGEKIDKYLYGNYSTMSLGYIGLYEVSKLMTGKSHTEEEGKEFVEELMKYMRKVVDGWKKDTNIGFALYGTPAESLCYRFAKIDEEKFGSIKDITDKGYYTNSYHVDVRENINAFDKLKFESSFQPISSGGCISYVEIPNMEKNYEALEEIVKFIYDNIQYAEFNTKSDVCNVCGHTGEIIINDELQWECPCCHNKDESKMSVTRRTCRISRRKLLE
jgi:anaerobic ribonucleoside-triphosphate reductase